MQSCSNEQKRFYWHIQESNYKYQKVNTDPNKKITCKVTDLFKNRKWSLGYKLAKETLH